MNEPAVAKASANPVEAMVDATPDDTKKLHTAWTGVLAVNLPDLGIQGEYTVKGVKVPTDHTELPIDTFDVKTKQKVVSKEKIVFYGYTEGPDGKRSEYQEIPYEQFKSHARYRDPVTGKEMLISARNENRYFHIDDRSNPIWTEEVPASEVGWFWVNPDGTAGEPGEPFTERTKRLEVIPDEEAGSKGWIPLDRVPQYCVEHYYALQAYDKERPSRLNELARKLLAANAAGVAFYTHGKTFGRPTKKYYTAIIWPYEGPDGRLWLHFYQASGRLIPQGSMALAEKDPEAPVQVVPTGRRPKVRLSV